ncbi:16S rRNA (uracil(1498)-N(3))-methyltransferase [Nitrosophilus alvini]|uniref:16S rRNA (uracil(1498)-N(3))-methyltransferase n=1 Tax=Nitrosophilus alvini TaxID=2714855 RepID=UPI00190B9C7D|nr:16S rRNA (uracil(1498)-N(3))-methyltransferase [Nitrosophilus alvini]
MVFIYHEEAGNKELKIEGDTYRYLFRARRHKVDDVICFRNLENSLLYHYKVIQIGKKNAFLELETYENKPVEPKRYFHLGWCVVDPKIVEKTLPMLNEIGVSKISFIYCNRSQKNFKINKERLKKILISSCQQCGRSSLMEIETIESLKKFSETYPEFILINFSKKTLYTDKIPLTAVIGCEGGFTDDELALAGERIAGFDTEMVLKSETAAVVISSKMVI